MAQEIKTVQGRLRDSETRFEQTVSRNKSLAIERDEALERLLTLQEEFEELQLSAKSTESALTATRSELDSTRSELDVNKEAYAALLTEKTEAVNTVRSAEDVIEELRKQLDVQ